MGEIPPPPYLCPSRENVGHTRLLLLLLLLPTLALTVNIILEHAGAERERVGRDASVKCAKRRRTDILKRESSSGIASS